MELQTTAQSLIDQRTESLTKQEWKSLKEYQKKFPTQVACATEIGVDRSVLNRVLLAGSGRPDKIEKIRAALAVQM